MIDLHRFVDKSALVYDLKSDCVLHRMDCFLHNDSNIRMLHMSNLGNAILDQRLRVYETMSAQLVSPKDQNVLLDLTGRPNEFPCFSLFFTVALIVTKINIIILIT